MVEAAAWPKRVLGGDATESQSAQSRTDDDRGGRICETGSFAGGADFLATAFCVALSRCERKVFGTLRMMGLTIHAKANGTVRLSSIAST